MMLVFAVDYRKVIDRIAGEKDMGLRDYEMDDEEWEIVQQLRDVLKVSHKLHVS